MTAAERAQGRSGLLEQLVAVVRPEFRAEVYIPAPDDPIFISDKCAVEDCDRTAESIRRGLCNAHGIRFRKRGCPPDFRNSIDDMVGLEAAYHGTAVTNIFCATGTCVPVAWQLSIGSNFLKTLNADDSASAVGFARVRCPLGAARVP